MWSLPPSLWAQILGKAGRHAALRCAVSSRMLCEVVAAEPITYESWQSWLLQKEEGWRFAFPADLSWDSTEWNSVALAIQAFKQYRAPDGLLHPEELGAACAARGLDPREAETEVRKWLVRDEWDPVPLSLTEFVSLCHGSHPLTRERLLVLYTAFREHDDQGDETVPSAAFTECGLWETAACEGMLPSYRAEGGRTNLNCETLPVQLRPCRAWSESSESASRRILSRMTFEEFVCIACVKKLWIYLDGETDVIEAFRILDSGCTGFISTVDLRHVLCGFGEVETPQVEQLIRKCDHGNDQIDYEEFIEAMMSL